jgi:hypothetical protein
MKVIDAENSREESTSPLQSQVIVHRDLNVLLGAQITLGSLDRGMAEEEFDLLQITTALAAELMGWSAAFSPLQLGYKRWTEEVFPCKYARLALISARRCSTWLA